MFLTGLHKKILEGLTGAVILIDDTQKVCYLNPSAEMLLEISEKRLKDAHINELFVEQDEQPSASISEAFHSGHPFTKREAELVLHSGSRVRVDYSASPYQDGKHHYMLLELQPRDRLLRISREEEMMAKQETTRILVRGLAHEIKNPLGGIRGAAQLLDRELDDGNLCEYTHIIIEEADRLRNLVDRMLGPNKLVKFKPTNIHEVLERVHNLISVESNSQIALMRDYDPSIPEFMGDQEQLIQAILNITRNAMEALISQEGRTLPGTITLKTRTLRQFTIGHERHRLVCRLDIIDNGPGIPSEFIQNIFYPMVSGRAEGTGLGLSIAQSIIGQHKGLIECESEPGRTDFIIYIPLELT
ncbi:MAG: nitrogen regulation protein NR(II) [Pseudomonadales bacterium]|uniref:Sensory histidine kinase/phosphatase NtrB n=1 Tax=Oleiphilus messinensis TaxID=141451 RepID=A0A1Y0I4W9_9GAMM|nr:nitrogen regulation protein NR(II) [Oleiphilus messinensis]ARU54826.1 nitrogen specific PAS/PAC sensor-containing signal transduction histidine kinase [Oleiphilus messinensis]MCG8613023.1 nitrogen regulation protein NR(II) [Pseudomonadales bacterium]